MNPRRLLNEAGKSSSIRSNPRQRIGPVTVVVATVLIVLVFNRTGAAQQVEFNRDIRPILADNCFPCHGPDAGSREADLRLDLEDELYRDRDAPVVVPGKPDRSELIRRVLTDDPSERMPPPDSNRQLTDKQRRLLSQWISQGAPWQKHWAFEIPSRPAIPRLNSGSESQWASNPIDLFVLARMRQHGLRPSPQADRATLIRRVSLDLTGLPPTADDVSRFLNDDSPNAYEKVVDRLLASPGFGERMAVDWLDAARYADSHGYSLDRRRVMWPWREWVIDAYNHDMPYDRFVIEQLAGDLLPDASESQVLASGFNRNHPIQSEGGVINEEYRVETVVDRVETTSAVFLALTMGCGRCHEHKYEPITQQEFYSFFAFFNNVPETAHVGNADNQADPPTIRIVTAQDRTRITLLESRLRELKARLNQQKPPEKPSRRADRVWVDDQTPDGGTVFGNGSGPQEFKWVGPTGPVKPFSGKRMSMRKATGRGQHGFQNSAHSLFARKGDRLFVQVYIDPDNPPREIMLQWFADNNWEHRAIWGDDLIEWGKIGTVSRFRVGDLPEPGRWVRLEVPVDKVGLAEKNITGMAFTQHDGTVFWDRAGINTVARNGLQLAIEKTEKEIKAIRDRAPLVMVMGEKKPRRETFVLARGQYDAMTRERVEPGVPAVLGELDVAGTANRLDLARWMVSQRNPLTARVAVNRFWQTCFGRGIVKSVEDFGTQGTPPTHPHLLDWLAIEFVRTGWDVKSMFKMIVMSATYRQSSVVTAERMQKDPENIWLSRSSRYRLSAETIRDQALAVSGLIVREIGGPSVRPYQPPGLWKDVVYSNVPKFKQDHGAALYRRSVYTYWKRSVPPPNLQTLDAPSREACTLARSRTNTPLANLVLWNDPTFVEAARVLAQNRLGKTNDPHRAAGEVFRHVLGRRPTSEESRVVDSTLKYFLRKFQEDREAASAFLKTGEYPVDTALDPAELAAVAALANALLGLDEVIVRN